LLGWIDHRIEHRDSVRSSQPETVTLVATGFSHDQHPRAAGLLDTYDDDPDSPQVRGHALSPPPVESLDLFSFRPAQRREGLQGLEEYSDYLDRRLADYGSDLTGRNAHAAGRNGEAAGRNPDLTGPNAHSAIRTAEAAGRSPEPAGRNADLTGRKTELAGRNSAIGSGRTY